MHAIAVGLALVQPQPPGGRLQGQQRRAASGGCRTCARHAVVREPVNHGLGQLQLLKPLRHSLHLQRPQHFGGRALGDGWAGAGSCAAAGASGRVAPALGWPLQLAASAWTVPDSAANSHALLARSTGRKRPTPGSPAKTQSRPSAGSTPGALIRPPAKWTGAESETAAGSAAQVEGSRWRGRKGRQR